MTENAAKERPRTSDLCDQRIKLNYQKQIQLNKKKKLLIANQLCWRDGIWKREVIQYNKRAEAVADPSR